MRNNNNNKFCLIYSPDNFLFQLAAVVSCSFCVLEVLDCSKVMVIQIVLPMKIN